MIDEPKSSEDYINYIPKRYNCISADDIFIESIVDKLLSVVCYWYSIDNKKNGLAYYGITLISPESCGSICKLIDDSDEYLQLKQILMEAYKAGGICYSLWNMIKKNLNMERRSLFEHQRNRKNN